jgi:hypothetical protein
VNTSGDESLDTRGKVSRADSNRAG